MRRWVGRVRQDRWMGIVFLLTMSSAPAFAAEVPPENQAKGPMPALDSARAMAELVLKAIAADTPEAAHQAFFPSDAFDLLKGIAKPHDYYVQLLKWYDADIHRLHERVKGSGDLSFDGFEAGHCVWKAVNTEANKLPYWSCYRNKFYAKSAKGRLSFDVKAAINWGATWYVTHLGGIPKP